MFGIYEVFSSFLTVALILKIKKNIKSICYYNDSQSLKTGEEPTPEISSEDGDQGNCTVMKQPLL
jgi:hypothetical protein